jgi:hypothetical protein
MRKAKSIMRIRYLKACRSAIGRNAGAGDLRWLANVRDQLGAVEAPPLRKEVEDRFERLVASRASLDRKHTRFQKEVRDAFDDLISFLEQNDH